MITYRTNTSGNLHAAYSGTVRIGYIETRRFSRFLWQLSLIRPGGGCYMGYEEDEQSAKDELEKSFVHWIASAELQPLKERANAKQRNKNGDAKAAKPHAPKRRRPTPG